MDLRANGRRLPRGLLGPVSVLASAGVVLAVGAALGVKDTKRGHPTVRATAAHRSRVHAPPVRVDPGHLVAVGAYIPGVPRHPDRLYRYIRMTGERPAIVSYFRDWQLGTFDATSLGRVARVGAVPMITWEPWGRPLGDIAGGRYDDYIRSTAADARRWGKPILVRFAHEMNGDWYPWDSASDPQTYIRAWRHVVSTFRAAGARNVGWVWAPNVDSAGPDVIASLYPGDRWVDWVGMSGFSWGGPWPWQAAVDVFRNTYDAIARVSTKPFMLAETSAGELGGNKAHWISETFGKDLRALPRVRAVIWFNGHEQWARWDVNSTPAALAAFRQAVAAPRYRATATDVVSTTWIDGIRTTGDLQSSTTRR